MAGRPKQLDELRALLASMDTRMSEARAGEAEATALAATLARRALDGDAEALSRLKDAETKVANCQLDQRRLIDARRDIESDLASKLEALARTDVEKTAAEAEAYAQTLPSLAGSVDKSFADFRRSLAALMAHLDEGRAKGFTMPSKELADSKLVRCLKSALTLSELRSLDMRPLPTPERTTFGEAGEAWSRGVLGGAKHLLAQPPKRARNGNGNGAGNGHSNGHSNGSAEKPRAARPDIGQCFPDDDPSFTVRIPHAQS